MSAQRFVLLHSPLIGPVGVGATATELVALGARAEAPVWPKLSTIEGGYYPALVRSLAATVDGAGREPAVLVAHSGAGPLLPALAAALDTPVAGAIFLDATLPHPGRSWLDNAPAETREALRAGAQMGQLPPWDDWWPPGALERIVPDAALRAALISELEPIPLAYLEEPAPAADLAELGAPAGYLQLSDAYADDIRAASRMGWAAVALPLQHLGPLTHPKAVARVLLSLAARLAETARA
jgi:hypothetical protein